MRSVLMVLVLVGLLAGPGLGVVNVKLTADNTVLSNGQTTTIRVLAQGSAAGLASLGGNINATGPAGLLTANAGSFAWVPAFSSPAPFPAKLGSPGSNGGWSSFGSQQTTYLSPDPTYGKSDFVEVASYIVTAGSGSGLVSLSFSNALVGGFKPVETDKTSNLGTFTPVTLEVLVPEPMSVCLLALAGLAAARRRTRQAGR